jgi:hypothetical protein
MKETDFTNPLYSTITTDDGAGRSVLGLNTGAAVRQYYQLLHLICG